MVDFAQLQAAVEQMARFESEVIERLEDIDHSMAALRSTWQGSGSEAHAQAQQQWTDGAEQMKTALSQLRQVAEIARRNYADAVTKNGQMWQ
ncbi:WXG100 family type VII secretion target [Mycolicibacterium thermoresistibile]